MNGKTRTFQIPGYQAVRIIGNGAHSTIWEVRSLKDSQTYALKRVVKNEKSDERFFTQTINEFEIASQLDHPNIRKVIELRRIRKLLAVKELHLIMEYCPGRNLQQAPPANVRDACHIWGRVGIALFQINQAGFVHSDMKPSNVIVDSAGDVKVIDFGQACPIGTVKERIQGTPDFIAPEQVNRQPHNERTDVFNFGASFYWTLTGKSGPVVLPHEGSLQLPGHNAVKPPSELNPEVAPMLSKLIMDCIELEPSHRPANMREVVMRLDVILRKNFTTVSGQ